MGGFCKWLIRYQAIWVPLILLAVIAGGFWLFWKPLMSIKQDAIRNLILIVAGVVGWYFLIQRTKTASQNTEIAEQGLTVDRLNRATKQLASDKASVRLGGIRGLEQIFRTHEEERDKIVRILVAFIHDFAPISSDTRTIQMRGKHSDIAEAIEVLAEITERFPSTRKAHLDLHDTNLSGLMFVGTNLSNFRFFGANFSNSHFWHVDFTDAILGMVNFSGVTIDDEKGLTQQQVRDAFYWEDNPPQNFPVELQSELEERDPDEEE